MWHRWTRIICFLPVLAAPTESLGGVLLHQEIVGSGTNNIFLQSLSPNHQLSFESRSSYFKSLSDNALIEDPSYLDWLLSTVGRIPKNKDSAKRAYAEFIKGKALLDGNACTLAYPEVIIDGKDGNDGGQRCDDRYEELLSAVDALESSLQTVQSGWSLLYRGIGHARLRAFGPALSDLESAKRVLSKAGAHRASLLAGVYPLGRSASFV